MQEMNSSKYLFFSIDNEEYGIDIKYVVEIIVIPKITDISYMSDCVKGVINLRGRIIPVMDVRARFNKDFREYDDKTCSIVINYDDICVGLIVDEVIEVTDILDKDIVVPPEVNSSINNKYIKGISKKDDKIRILIDCSELIDKTGLGT